VEALESRLPLSRRRFLTGLADLSARLEARCVCRGGSNSAICRRLPFGEIVVRVVGAGR